MPSLPAMEEKRDGSMMSVTRPRKLSYDGECLRLAEYFLTETVCGKAEQEDLAQDIQDAVESWMLDWERKHVPPQVAPYPLPDGCGWGPTEEAAIADLLDNEEAE